MRKKGGRTRLYTVKILTPWGVMCIFMIYMALRYNVFVSRWYAACVARMYALMMSKTAKNNGKAFKNDFELILNMCII